MKVAVAANLATEVPFILTLDMHGVSHRWVTWQHACFYYAKDLVAWAVGEANLVFHGGVHLLYAPYVPNKAEFLILSNRRILHDQMDFLARHVPRHSRTSHAWIEGESG